MNHKLAQTLRLCLVLALTVAATAAPQTAEDPGQKALAQSSPGLLSIVVYDKDKKEIGRGSAIVLTEEIAATNYHLISRAAGVVGFNYRKKEVDVLGVVAVNKALDLALIQIDGKVQPLAPAAAELAEGLKVLALGSNETGDIIVSSGAVRRLLDLGGGIKVADSSVSVPESFSGGAVMTEDGKLIGLVTVLESRARFILPIAAVAALNKSAKPTPFKSWTAEDYGTVIDGNWLAARIFKWQDDTLNAQRNLEKVTKAQPTNLDAWSMLADVYNRQRDMSNAQTAFGKVIELDPNRATAYLGLGEILIRMQKPLDAAQNLEKAISLDPSRSDALMLLGNAYEDAREFVKASDAYEKYLATNPANSWMTFQRLGMCRFEAGLFDQAAAAFAEASKAQPQDQSILYRLAQSYEKGGKFEQAESAYKKLAEVSPKDAVNYYGAILGMYDRANNTPKAVEAARKIVELNPKDEKSYTNLGSMYLKMQKYTDAIVNYKKALEIKPNYDYPWFQVGYCYYALKNYAEALPFFQKNVELVSDNHYGFLYIGMCYMQVKQFAKALDPMKKASDLKPDDGTALFNLGVIYLNLKDKYSALDVAKRLQTVDANLAAKLRGYIK